MTMTIRKASIIMIFMMYLHMLGILLMKSLYYNGYFCVVLSQSLESQVKHYMCVHVCIYACMYMLQKAVT